MNYKAMLMKYLCHINSIEGATHLQEFERNDVCFEDRSMSTVFTDEEWAEMQKLHEGVEQMTVSEVKEL